MTSTKIERDGERVRVIGDEPQPEDYCLTEETIRHEDNVPANWPVWYAELCDLRNSAMHAVETIDADYRAWRGKFEENIQSRYTKDRPAHSVKREVEASRKFHVFKLQAADAAKLARKFDAWAVAILCRVNLHTGGSIKHAAVPPAR